jgi:hypothetical protein
MTHDQLMALQDVLADMFDEAYAKAQQEIAATGHVSNALAMRLTATQEAHAEVVAALIIEATRPSRN